VFRGQAYVNLTFRTLEIDNRLIPVQMSILTLEQPRSGGSQKTRKDVKVMEGQAVEEKRTTRAMLSTQRLAPAAARLSAPSSATWCADSASAWLAAPPTLSRARARK
jgi:hypothetical protein